MIRMTRLTDYGIMLLTLFARDAQHPMKSARDLSRESFLGSIPGRPGTVLPSSAV